MLKRLALLTLFIALPFAACDNDDDGNDNTGTASTTNTTDTNGGSETSATATNTTATNGSNTGSNSGTTTECNETGIEDPNETCEGYPEYVQCVQTTCKVEFEQCLGTDGQGGTCAAHTACIRACNCDDTCVQNCAMNDNGKACTTCLGGTLGPCVLQNCYDLLKCDDGTNTTDSNTGSNTGATCAQLAVCCETLTDSQKTTCNSVVSAGDANGCSMAFDAFQCQ